MTGVDFGEVATAGINGHDAVVGHLPSTAEVDAAWWDARPLWGELIPGVTWAIVPAESECLDDDMGGWRPMVEAVTIDRRYNPAAGVHRHVRCPVGQARDVLAREIRQIAWGGRQRECR